MQAFVEAQKNAFSSLNDTYITENVSDISNVVRGKVFQNKHGFARVMSDSETNMLLKEYIGYVWAFWQDLPSIVANCITAIVMVVVMIITETIQSPNMKHTIVFSLILLICIVSFGVLFKVRMAVRNVFRPANKENRKENEVLFNDIKNIEPLIKKEFTFRVKLLKQNLVEKRMLEKKALVKLNTTRIMKSCILAIFMVIIVVLKMSYAGGISNLTIGVMTDIFAVSAIYSGILDKISNILFDLEKISNTIREAGNSKEDVDIIMDTYWAESSLEVSHENVDRIQLAPFEFSYSNDTNVYRLRNTKSFVLEKGKAYGVFAPTGAGKTTLMQLITGKIRMDESPISYGPNCQRAYVASIMSEANGRLGSQDILSEITFGEAPITHKLLRILKGTHIYYDILRNLGLREDDDNSVLEYLANTTAHCYSSGQKQRLGIVKLLYNMTEDHQIVVFDEATNALDDPTAVKVLSFISSFCQEDSSRIVFFVTHQEGITREIADGAITLEQKNFPAWDIVLKSN